MALPRFEEDIEFIQKLADEPNDVGGYTAAELKAEFDKAGLAVQSFINNVLLPYFEGIYGAENVGIQPVGGLTGVADLQSALEKIEEQMAEMTQGAVADNSITTAKLADFSVTGEKLAEGAVTDDKLSDEAVLTRAIAALNVTTEKLAALCVTTEKIATNAVTTGKLSNKSVTTAKLGDKAVGSGQIDDLAVTTAKLFAGAVTEEKIASNAVTNGKVADGAVSRAKLANDAIYSPMQFVDAATWTISAQDSGKTLEHVYAQRNDTNGLTILLTDAISKNLPVGFEFANVYVWGYGTTIDCSDVRTCILNEGATVKGRIVRLTEIGSMVAFKKIESAGSAGDVWLVTGNCEVTA